MNNIFLQRTWAVARKEIRHVTRDARSLTMALAIPFMMIVLFGYVLTLDVDEVPTRVWDRSKTPESRQLLSKFVGSKYFTIEKHVNSYDPIVSGLSSGEISLGIVIPADFDENRKQGKKLRVQAIIDGTNANNGMIIRGYLRQLSTQYNFELQGTSAYRHGSRADVIIKPRVWYNPNMKSANFIIPGLITIIMMIVGALLMSQTIAREWETGTMEALVSTPVTRGELILGKLIPYFAIGLFDVLVAVVLGVILFGVPLQGSITLLAIGSAIFMTVALALGLVISIITKSQLPAAQMAMVATFLPTFLLSGFVFPIENMPYAVQLFTLLVPARYFITITLGIFLKGIGLMLLYKQFIGLIVFGGVLLILARNIFQKRIA